MLLRWIGKLNEGSLLRRTLLHIGMFVLGSACFVALVSVALVTTTKALLPSHDTTETAVNTAKEEQGSPEEAASIDGAPQGRKAYAQRRATGQGEDIGVR